MNNENNDTAKSGGGREALALASAPTPADALGLSTTHIRPQRADMWQANLYAGGNLIEVHAPGIRGQRGGGKRGTIRRFSGASRRRLLRALSRTKREQLPVFITLTYPDGFPGDPRRWKADLKAWLKRVHRQFPTAAGFWKLELAPRQSGTNEGAVAPHFHLLLWGLPEEWEQPDATVWSLRFMLQQQKISAPGLVFWKQQKWRDGVLSYTCETITGLEDKGPVQEFASEYVNKEGQKIRSVESWREDPTGQFEESLQRLTDSGYAGGKVSLLHWVSLTWAEVVKSGDPRHVRAGTRVEQIRGRKGVMFYASKYISKLDTEAVGNAGRFWGIHNVNAVPWAEAVKVPLDRAQAVQVMRVARRYIWAGPTTTGASAQDSLARQLWDGFFL